MQRDHEQNVKYLSSLLETKKVESPLHDNHEEITSSIEHPVFKHFLNENNPAKSHFIKHIVGNFGLPASHSLKFIEHASSPHDVSLVAEKSDDPKTHEIAYDRLREMKANIAEARPQTHSYGFLRHTTNQRVIQRAHDDLKTAFRNRDPDGHKTAQYYPMTRAHLDIAQNPNTPTHILQDIIHNKPLHGFHESDDDPKQISAATGRYPSYNSDYKIDNAGFIAMNNLLTREDSKKAQRKLFI
jgi:hypothetical protein